MGHAVPSEVDAQSARITSLATAAPAALLKEGLLPLQASRSAAYGRLNDALRAWLASPGSNYALVCANCTEDFKLASEGVLELRSVCAERALGEAEFAPLVALIDRLQALEERKMAAVVSVHAVKRSRKEGGDEAVLRALGDDGSRGGVEDRIIKYSQTLRKIDEDIAEVMEEVREIVFDAEEEEGEAGE